MWTIVCLKNRNLALALSTVFVPFPLPQGLLQKSPKQGQLCSCHHPAGAHGRGLGCGFLFLQQLLFHLVICIVSFVSTLQSSTERHCHPKALVWRVVWTVVRTDLTETIISDTRNATVPLPRATAPHSHAEVLDPRISVWVPDPCTSLAQLGGADTEA